LAKLLEEAVVSPVANPKASQYGGNTAKEQLEKFFMDMFRKYGVCNLAFLKQNLAERQKDKGKLVQGMSVPKLVHQISSELSGVKKNLSGNCRGQ